MSLSPTVAVCLALPVGFHRYVTMTCLPFWYGGGTVLLLPRSPVLHLFVLPSPQPTGATSFPCLHSWGQERFGSQRSSCSGHEPGKFDILTAGRMMHLPPDGRLGQGNWQRRAALPAPEFPQVTDQDASPRPPRAVQNHIPIVFRSQCVVKAKVLTREKR